MKKILPLFLILLFIANSLFADDDRVRMRPQDRFIFDAFFDIWQDVPDGMDLEFYNRGINISLFRDYPLGYSNFSIAPGINFSSHNMYSDHWFKYDDGKFDFISIKEKGLSYDNNKISLNYIDIPVEFRYRTRPHRDMPHPFRISVGAKLGYLIQAHTKYVGDVYLDNNGSENTRETKIKEYNLNNIESWRYGLTARIGYGYVNIIGYYPLNRIFKDNLGKDMYPISIGASFIIN